MYNNKLRSIGVFFIVLLINANTALGAVSVPESMKLAMKDNSDMPSLLNLVLSMIVVIAMIYFTGWVYQKLNKINKAKLANASFLEKKSFNVISSMPLGQQKNLYAVEFNDKILVVGATAQNITLLKEFSKEEKIEMNTEDTSKISQGEDKSQNLDLLYKKYKN